MPDLRVLRGGVLPDRPELGPVDILLKAECIEAIAPAGSLDAGRNVLDIAGVWVLPGVIDAHVHPIHAESFESVGQESVLGGITTALQHLYPEPGESLPEAVARATSEGARAAADFGYHLRLTRDRVDGMASGAPLASQLAEAAASAGVLSVKAFLAHADPKIMSSESDLVRICMAAAAADLPVIVHAEPGEAISALEELCGVPANLAEHDRLRSMDLEAASVAMAVAIAKSADARIYVAHMSNPLAVEVVRTQRAAGSRARGESCTHYFFLDSGAALGGLGRVTPPLRSRDAVVGMRALLADPLSGIDVVASDHCGYEASEKPKGHFAQAGNGLPGADSMLPLLIDAVLTGGWLRPADIVRLLASGPASTFGLVGKGAIAPGSDADLVLVDPCGTTTLAPVPFGVATAVSPYAGTSLRGAISQVLRRGVDVVVEGVPTGVGGGRTVRRTSPTW